MGERHLRTWLPTSPEPCNMVVLEILACTTVGNGQFYEIPDKKLETIPNFRGSRIALAAFKDFTRAQQLAEGSYPSGSLLLLLSSLF